ncbi:MAG: hypothetical protein DDT26_01051 [Dehalococcoidia bacterium]|nr:hypothetical protein [Chloroflexota bacterium]
MRPKGIKGIALLVAAVLLLVTPLAAIAGGRGNDAPRYWWEEGYLTPYERELARDIMVLILDAYFRIDISRMTSEEMDEVGRLIGYDGQEKVLRLFEHYAHKKGFEMPEPPEPPAPLPVEPEPYWWEIADPEAEIEGIMKQVAEAKGMSPDEVRGRFGELFPGVDLWNMTFYEFSKFLNSLPRPARRPLSFDDLKRNPRIIALFGRVPAFSTEQELEEFNQKLEKVLSDVAPLLRQLCRYEFPLGALVASQGAISVAVRSDHLPRAEEVYEMIAKKAESLFGIQNVPVTFSNAVGGGPQGPPSSPTSTGWAPPWNEPFPEIPGAVKVTPADDPARYTTASFAVQRFRWYWPWDPDEDYIITGHKGPSETITPVNMRINQPTPGYEAGRVSDNVGTHTYADAARVGISDARVRPYILIGGTPSQPALRPVFASGDPALGESIWISAGRTGLTFSVNVLRRHTFKNWGPWVELKNQFLVRPVGDIWAIGGDSGSPYWHPVWDPVKGIHGAKIHGLHVGWEWVHGREST